MNEDGFIVLHRKFLEWEWYKDQNTKLLFLHLLINANWKEGRFMGHVIPRGSLVVGRKQLAQDLGMSEQSVRTSLTKLKSTNEITITSTNKFSIVNIVKYCDYQDKKFSNQPANQPANQPTTNQQLTTIEQRNNNNIYISSKIDDFDVFWKAYPKKVGKQAAIKAFNKIKVDINTLLAAVEAQKQSNQWQKNGGQFIPNPATWLNQGRWEDELQGAEQPQASYESELERLYG